MASRRSVIAAWRLSSAPLKPYQQRTFTYSARCMINPLFNLSHFSASKEAQYFSKERKIPQEEFYPYLELIRASEVDPFAPAPGSSPTVVAALKKAQAGKSDMQTAYSLAVANLIQQLQFTRKEAMQTQALLTRVHEKYRREERNSFIIMLAAIGAFALIFVKTDAIDDLKDYARQATSRWKTMDVEWLGNPPSHKSTAYPHRVSAAKPEALLVQTTTVTTKPLAPIEAQSDWQARKVESVHSGIAETATPTRWKLSRLFWAAS